VESRFSHLDLFSGIGGFALAGKRVWGDKYKNLGHSEIESFPCKVYHKHFPESKCLGDIKNIEKIKADILTAGFPCQDVSIAGDRKGLAGKQTGLFWRLAEYINLSKPNWFVLENVPGLISSNGYRDFWTVIAALEQFGYCVAWRILNAQYFGVAQRRKRVWIVGSLGNTSAVKVLFKQESGVRNDSEVGKIRERGLCISTRDGGKQDSTSETLIANVIQASDYRKTQHGQFGNEGNLIAQTSGATPRGNTSFIWQDTYIAETHPIGKGKVDGISRGLDRHRGKGLGNAIVPQVAQSIFQAIKEIEDAK